MPHACAPRSRSLWRTCFPRSMPLSRGSRARPILAARATPASLAQALRRLRARVLLHTLLRDLTGRAELTEVCATIDAARRADVACGRRSASPAIDAGLRRADRRGVRLAAAPDRRRHGQARRGGAQRVLGCRSGLRLSRRGSHRRTEGASNQEFFDRLGRQVIAALADVTADGFVFRVDMRLRPYGDSGPLASSFAALEQYLVTQGRTWERYAWLKARALSGDARRRAGRARRSVRVPQVSRFRRVHRLARRAPANPRAGPAQGPCAQYQARARRHPRNRIHRPGAAAGPRRQGAGPARARHAAGARRARRARASAGPAIAELASAYVFLRNLEHRLQYRDDQQVHDLPTDAQRAGAAGTGLRARRDGGPGCHDRPVIAARSSGTSRPVRRDVARGA